MFSERFGTLFSEGLLKLQAYRKVSPRVVENELIRSLDCQPDMPAQWRQGYVPSLFMLEKLVRYLREQDYFYHRFLDGLKDSVLTLTPTKLHHNWIETEEDTTQMYALLPNHNLPNLPPAIQELLKSQEAMLREVIQGLESRWRLVSITGLPGVGKSTLAIHAARHILHYDPTHFRWAVYITGKSQPLTLNYLLTTLVNSVNPNWTGMWGNTTPNQIQNIIQLLREERILIVLDNFDTHPPHPEVLEFLYQVPEPSKVLITTRTAELRYDAYTIELRGIQRKEAIQIANYYALSSGLTTAWQHEKTRSDIQQLVENTEGNPFISRILPVCITLATQQPTTPRWKWEWVAYNQALLTGESTAPDIAINLLHGIWEALTQPQQGLLKAFAFFVDSAPLEALVATAGIDAKHQDRPITEEVEELSRFGLIDPLTAPLNAPRYTIHSLTTQFLATLREQDETWYVSARHRWLKWYERWVTEQDKHEWNDYEARRMESANLFAVMTVLQKHPLDITPPLARGLHRYLVFQGLWSDATELALKWHAHFGTNRKTVATALWLRSHIALLKLEQNQVADAIQELKIIERSCEWITAGAPEKYNPLVNKIKVFLYLGQAYNAEANADNEAEIHTILEKGLRIATAMRDDGNIIRFRYQQAVAYLQYGKDEKAVPILQNLLIDERCQRWIRAKGYILIRLINAFVNLGELSNADQQVYNLRNTMKFPKDEPLLDAARLMAIAKLEAAQGSWEKALGRVSDAIEIYERFNHLDLEGAKEFRRVLAKRRPAL